MLIVNNRTFLTPSEAAGLLGISKRTVIRWCANGSGKDRRPSDPPDLQPVRGPNRRLYFHEEHIKSIAAKYFGEEQLNHRHVASAA
jgi:predicted site-specific integrase-resolvase